MESMVNDMKISKRGGAEPSLNFAIGMIIGITIILIFGGIVLKFWMASQQTRESFDLFTEELLELEEMGEGDEVLFVSDKYNIVAFTADDLVSECVPNTLMHPFEEQMKKPVGCGNEPCICYCKIGASGLILDTNCQKSGYCKSLKDLDPHWLATTLQFFTHYKDLEKDKISIVNGWLGKSQTKKIIIEANKRWKKKLSSQLPDL